jgi:hypothetical protein
LTETITKNILQISEQAGIRYFFVFDNFQAFVEAASDLLAAFFIGGEEGIITNIERGFCTDISDNIEL